MEVKCSYCEKGEEPQVRYGYYTHIEFEEGASVSKFRLCTARLPHYVITAVKEALDAEFTRLMTERPAPEDLQ